MRAVLVATAVAALILGATACGSGSGPTYPVNVYVAGKHFASVAPGHPSSFLPKALIVQQAHGEIFLHVDQAVANTLVDQALANHQGRVDLPYTRVRSFIKMELQHQLFHHDSEVTALSMIASSVGIDAPQVRLVPLLRRNGPAAPQPIPGSKLFRWGDPEKGFVGKPNAPGPRGGFGVYEAPIRRLGAKSGVHLVGFDGKSVAAVRTALFEGHPLIAWVDWDGAAGGHTTWVTPSGKKITVSVGERAIVLTGAGPGYYLLNDPGSGKEYKWSLSRFSTRWQMLGRRALELP